MVVGVEVIKFAVKYSLAISSKSTHKTKILFYAYAKMTFLTIATIHFLACLVPGPAFFYILNVLAEKDFKSATKVVIGITLGNALEILLSVLGISVLATLGKEYPAFFYLTCAGLLFYLGAKSLMGFFSKTKTSNKPINSNKYILTGFTITMFNPKALLFWPLVLLPVVINYNVICKILTGLYFIVATFVLIWLEVYLFSIFKEKMLKYLRYVQAFFGLAMIGFSLLMIWKIASNFLHF